MKPSTKYAAALVVAVFPSQVWAQQPWLADRRLGEGIGIRAGNLEIHPGIAGEVGYDNNYFLRAESERPLAVYRLRITPSLSFSTLGFQRRAANPGIASTVPAITFRVGAYVAYNEFLAADSANSKQVSDQRHLDAGANARFSFLADRPVSVDLNGDFLRIGEPSNDLATINAFDRDTVSGGLFVNWRPGGGLFNWSLGYEATYNYFERSAFESFNNFQHGPRMRGRWRFLPKTALIYDGQYNFVKFSNSNTLQNDGDILKTRFGINGLLTTRLSLLGLFGWGVTFYEPRGRIPATQYDSFLAQGELKWFLQSAAYMEGAGAPAQQATTTGLSWIAAGYTRDFSTSYLGSFYSRDRGYLSFSYFYGGVFLATLEGGYSRASYPDSYFQDGTLRTADFSQDRVDARVFGEYRFSDTFGLNATVRYDQAIGGTAIRVDNRSQVTDNLEFARWQAFLGARWFL